MLVVQHIRWSKFLCTILKEVYILPLDFILISVFWLVNFNYQLADQSINYILRLLFLPVAWNQKIFEASWLEENTYIHDQRDELNDYVSASLEIELLLRFKRLYLLDCLVYKIQIHRNYCVTCLASRRRKLHARLHQSVTCEDRDKKKWESYV